MDGTEAHVNFDEPAVLRKWPSLHNERRTGGLAPICSSTARSMSAYGSREYKAKPVSIRHLYEIHTSPQPPLVSPVLSEEHIIELARLRDFL